MASNTEELLARYREIDRLLLGSRQSTEFRRWQAATLDLMRKNLGFHPAVVEFQGLRFRAGPVHAAAADELAAIPPSQHDVRMRQDLAEAKRLLRRALAHLGVDAEAPPQAAAPAPAPAQAALEALLAAVAEAGGAAPEGALAAAGRLRQTLADPAPAWTVVAPDLQALLGLGLPVARAAIAAVSTRLGDLR